MAIRVHKIEEMGAHTIRLMIHGGSQEAQYVSGRLNMEKGVKIGDPYEDPGTKGTMIYLDAQGPESTPLTVQKVRRLLDQDPEIEVVVPH